MDSISGDFSAAKVANDESKKQEYSSPTGKPPSDQRANRNIMIEKFQANVKLSLSQYAYTPKPFFFYSSLTDPLRLKEVLQLLTPPFLKPARVKSFKIMQCGQYPALVDGPNNSYVDGMAYVVETELQQKMLEHYETDAYNVEGIRMTVEGKEVFGRTFMWDYDLTEPMEGRWSLEEWKNRVEEEMASHFRPLKDYLSLQSAYRLWKRSPGYNRPYTLSKSLMVLMAGVPEMRIRKDRLQVFWVGRISIV